MSQDPVPVEHVELVPADAQAPATAAARHVDVVGLVVVVGCPYLSHRRYCVVWTRRMKMTSLLIGQARYCPSAHMDETCLFMEEMCMV